MSKYQKLSMALESIRHSTRLPIQPYITIPIPPVPLLVLQRSRHTGDLVKGALETREEFAHLRDSLRVLREELGELSMSPQKKMRALSSWKKSWSTLDEHHEQSSFIDLAAASNNLIDVAETLGGIGLDAIRWSNLIEKVIGEFAHLFYKWRVRVLHKAAKNYLVTSDYDLNHEVKRLFQYEVDEEDFKRLKATGISL